MFGNYPRIGTASAAKEKIMKKISLLFTAVLLLTPVFAKAIRNAATGRRKRGQNRAQL